MKTKTYHKKETEISKALSETLASTYALYLKTQNYHWNVKGPSFYSLHLLFEKQYTELANDIDEIAERISSLDCYVDGSFKMFSDRSVVKDAKKGLSSDQMLKDLIKSHNSLVKLIQPFVERFTELGDDVSADLIIKRLTFHETAVWMLSSHV